MPEKIVKNASYKRRFTDTWVHVSGLCKIHFSWGIAVGVIYKNMGEDILHVQPVDSFRNEFLVKKPLVHNP